VDDRPGPCVKAVLRRRVPLDHGAAVALLDAAIAERAPDVGRGRRFLAPAAAQARHYRGPGMFGNRNLTIRFGCTTHARPVSGSCSACSAASATNDGSISGAGSAPRTSCATIGVFVNPGQRALIRTPRASSCGATLRTKPTTACFVVA